MYHEVRCSPPDLTRGIRIDKIDRDQSMMLFFMNVHIYHRIMFYHLFLSMPQYMHSRVYHYFNYIQLCTTTSQYDFTTDALVFLADYVATLAPDV